MKETKSLKQRFLEAKDAMKWKAHKLCDWCGDHKAELVVFGPPMISGAIEIIKIAARRKNVSEERRLKDNYIYDRSNGHYYEVKRKLKSSEWLQIDERKEHGERLGAILLDMNVLKK